MFMYHHYKFKIFAYKYYSTKYYMVNSVQLILLNKMHICWKVYARYTGWKILYFYFIIYVYTKCTSLYVIECRIQIKLNFLTKRVDSESHIGAGWAGEMEICDIYFISARYSYLYTGISAALVMKSGISFGATFNPPLASLFRAFTLFIIFGFMYIFSFSFRFISSLFLFLYDSPSTAAPLSSVSS